MAEQQPTTHLASNGNGNGNVTLEKDFSRGQHDMYLESHTSPDDALRRIRTAGSVSMSPELFEKLYLNPPNKVSGDLRKRFGNPTPLGLTGFLLCLHPLSFDLMGWRGSGGNGAAQIGAFLFFGGVLMILAAVGEWIMGNTFPFIVFAAFGAFYLTYSITLQPAYYVFGSYSTTSNPQDGLDTVGFNSSFAFLLLTMGILCLVFLICALRTNIVFCGIFACLTTGFGLLTGAFFQISNGNAAYASTLQIAAGAVLFVCCLLGWWIFFAVMIASLDFPFSIPLGDLSGVVKSATELRRARGEENV